MLESRAVMCSQSFFTTVGCPQRSRNPHATLDSWNTEDHRWLVATPGRQQGFRVDQVKVSSIAGEDNGGLLVPPYTWDEEIRAVDDACPDVGTQACAAQVACPSTWSYSVRDGTSRKTR